MSAGQIHENLTRNRLKLGLFAFNGAGNAVTRHPDQRPRSWEDNVRIARQADGLGLEALVSFARWLPSGGDGNPTGRIFDPIAWAAGLGAVTRQALVVSTIHVPAFSPVAIAKTAATIDHITNGRFGINIVVGWNKPEMELFGATLLEHDKRYDLGAEWLEVMERLWREERRFDFEGDFYRLRAAVSDPRPIRARPVLMNAGGSPKGQDFAARHCDIAFVVVTDSRPEAISAQVEAYRKLAWERYRRELQVWTHAYVVQRPSKAQAEDYVEEYAGKYGDVVAADEFVAGTAANSQYAPPEVMSQMRRAVMAGGAGFPLLGNAEDIAGELTMLANAGIDGVLLSWLNFEEGLGQFGDSVLPMLEDAGFRNPYPTAG